MFLCIVQLPLILGTEESNIVETFNIAHTAMIDTLSDMSFIPRTFNPHLDDRKPSKAGKKLSTVDKSFMVCYS